MSHVHLTLINQQLLISRNSTSRRIK